MFGRAFTISTLFALARRAARETKMDEIRAKTEMADREARQLAESASQENNLARMRAATQTQMQMALASSGVSPMLTMGGGAGGGVNATHIQQAAVNRARKPSGAGHGY